MHVHAVKVSSRSVHVERCLLGWRGRRGTPFVSKTWRAGTGRERIRLPGRFPHARHCTTMERGRGRGVARCWPIQRCSFLPLRAELDGRRERGTTSRKQPKPARLLKGFGRDGEEGEKGSELRENWSEIHSNSTEFNSSSSWFDFCQQLFDKRSEPN